MIQVKDTQKQYFYQLLFCVFILFNNFFSHYLSYLKVAMEVLKSGSLLKTELFDRKKYFCYDSMKCITQVRFELTVRIW